MVISGQQDRILKQRHFVQTHLNKLYCPVVITAVYTCKIKSKKTS